MRKADHLASIGVGKPFLQKSVGALDCESASAEQAEKLLAVHGKTFHFATRFFPLKYRHAVVSLYAFFRTLDDLVDERTESWDLHEVRAELEAWQIWFQHGCVSLSPREPLGATLATLQQEYQIPLELFLDFLCGLNSDLEPREFQQTHELYHYCYQVAGTVGLAMTYVLGGQSRQALIAAKELGIAMQLTNILRDVGRDLAAGRIYLPADELARFALSPADLYQLFQEQGEQDERFCQLMRAQVQRARVFYIRGLHGVWLLTPECRPPVLLAGRLYQRILTEIERCRYDVFRNRASTSLLTKLREAGIVLLLHLLWRGGEVPFNPETEVLYEED
ncbi:MAG TPA: phytoene/squalene synthase family protein [Ktedonobacteraceae bacterium]